MSFIANSVFFLSITEREREKMASLRPHFITQNPGPDLSDDNSDDEGTPLTHDIYGGR